MSRIGVILILCFLGNYGCSVGMALSGTDNPDLDMVRTGATRGEIESTLGPPVSTVFIDGRKFDVYDYELGNEPSVGRALGHGVMDIFTFGIWEMMATPEEEALGSKHRLHIAYDKNDRAIAIFQSTPPAK